MGSDLEGGYIVVSSMEPNTMISFSVNYDKSGYHRHNYNHFSRHDVFFANLYNYLGVGYRL